MLPTPEAVEPALPATPWSRGAEAIAAELDVVSLEGLSEREAAIRLHRFGPNALRRTQSRTAWSIIFDQLKSFVTILLGVGAAVSFAFGHVLEGGSIVAVIGLNTAIGAITELRAVRSMEGLRRLGSVEAVVRRGGEVSRISAEALVPGDIVVFEGGDIVTADVRVVEASRLLASESALTGESLPVEKSVATVDADAPLAERASMLFKGTAVTRGACAGIVVATGMATELGRISALVEQGDAADTPLEERLDRLGRSLAWASLAFVVLVAAVGAIAGRDLFTVIETAIALAVATVPEGLPIVATLALARGMWRMARRNALIEELPAVETLGSTSLILTDKTGTLTENTMTVETVSLREAEDCAPPVTDTPPATASMMARILSAGALCTDAVYAADGGTSAGDPLEVALLAAAHRAGLRVDDLRDERPEVREEAFDPVLKMMATIHQTRAGFFVAVKGAPEAVVEACTHEATEDGARPMDAARRGAWLERAIRLGDDGLRTLAVASKTVDGVGDAPYENLELLGLLAFRDPPRAAVRDTVLRCRAAGIRVVMVTGDQAGTARAIARAVGILDPDVEDGVVLGRDLEASDEAVQRRVLQAGVVARTSPEQKLDLLGRHQAEGAVVAMIGDGVNDAPALKQADIGVAMGQRGTQVAREAAAMVLQDDELDSVVAAVEQGRVIFGNIRAFVVYLVSCNLGEIATVGVASMIGMPLPILPMQILFLNLVTDVFPALALGVGEGEPNALQQPPRDAKEPFLTRLHWLQITGYAALLSVPVFAALGIARFGLGLSLPQAVTVSFLTLAFSQMFHVFNMARGDFRLFSTDVAKNPWIWGALVLCTGLLVAAVYTPGLDTVLHTEDPGPEGWLVVGGLSLVPLIVGRLVAAVRASVAASR